MARSSTDWSNDQWVMARLSTDWSTGCDIEVHTLVAVKITVSGRWCSALWLISADVLKQCAMCSVHARRL
jgi:hypothetical protein